jgi:nucleotide-binding universal stress UspA family protein
MTSTQKHPRQIVIGYDGSDQAEDALQLGRIFAEILAARPLVVDIATWPSYLISEDEVERALHEEIDPHLEAAEERLAGLEPVTRAVRAQSVAGELATIARDEHALALVVGSSRHGTVGRVAMGSVGASLIHGAPCPVGVAPHGLAKADDRHLLRVGVGFDGSSESWSALETGIGLAERAHARLTVLTVADFPSYGLSSAWSVASAGELADAEHRERQRVLDLAIGRVPDDLAVEGRLMTGDAAGLLAEASLDFDLMVMGSRGHGAVGRIFLGAVSTRVIHHAGCSVLVLPRGAGADPLRLSGHEQLQESA